MSTAPSRLTRVGAAVAACLLGASAMSAESAKPAAPAPAAGASAANTDEAASYSLGIAFATEWKEGGLTDRISEPAMMRGIHDALAGKAMSPEDRKQASDFLQHAYERLSTRNDEAAKEFLAKNAKEPGVKSTPSGVQYIVLTPGDANSPVAGPNDRVTVNYRGTLLNGTEFDSSYARGKPAAIRPSTVIAGWREILPLMGKHAKWKVFVPPALAYGTSPPAAIPTNSLLVFEIEIVDIESAGAAAGGR